MQPFPRPPYNGKNYLKDRLCLGIKSSSITTVPQRQIHDKTPPQEPEANFKAAGENSTIHDSKGKLNIEIEGDREDVRLASHLWGDERDIDIEGRHFRKGSDTDILPPVSAPLPRAPTVLADVSVAGKQGAPSIKIGSVPENSNDRHAIPPPGIPQRTNKFRELRKADDSNRIARGGAPPIPLSTASLSSDLGAESSLPKKWSLLDISSVFEDSQIADDALNSLSLLAEIELRNTKAGAKKESYIYNNYKSSHRTVLDRLRNGGWREIIESIASGQTEFCYMEPCNGDPYKLRIVSHAPKSSETYLTFSRHGIVRYVNGESYHSTLEQFMRERAIYKKLQEMPVFRLRRLWKSLLFWKISVKQMRFERRAAMLKSRLICGDDDLLEMYSYACHRCAELSRISVFTISSDICYDLENFIGDQKKVQAHAMTLRDKDMDALSSYIFSKGENYTVKGLDVQEELVDGSHKAEVFSVFEGSSLYGVHAVSTYGLHTTFDNSSVFVGEGNGKEGKLDGGGGKDSLSQHMSIGSTLRLRKNEMTGEELGFSYTERATIRLSCRRLRTLFKLIDFMISDALCEAIHVSLQTLHNYISGLDLRIQMINEKIVAEQKKLQRKKRRRVNGEIAQQQNLRQKEKLKLKAEDSDTMSDDDPITETHVSSKCDIVNSKDKSRNDGNTGEDEEGIKMTRIVSADQSHDVVDKEDECSGEGDDNEGEEGEEGEVGERRDGIHLLQSDKIRVMMMMDECNVTRPQNSIIQVRVSLVDNQFEFSPPLDYVLQSFQGCLTGALDLVAQFNSVFVEPSLKTLLVPISNEIEDVVNRGNKILFDEEGPLHTLINASCKLLQEDIQKVLIEVANYKHFSDDCLRLSKLKKNMSVGRIGSMSIAEIDAILTDIASTYQSCVDMILVKDIGLIRLHFENVQNTMFEAVNDCKRVMHHIIPEHFVALCENLYLKIFQVKENLAVPPKTLDELVKLLELYATAMEQKDEVFDCYSHLVNFSQELVVFHSIPMSIEMESQKVSLSIAWYQYNDIVSDFGDSMDERIKKYRKELEMRSKHAMEPMHAAKELLDSHRVSQADSDPEDVLYQLNEKLKMMEAARVKLIGLEHFQTVMRCIVFNMAPFNEIYSRLINTRDMWLGVKSIQSLHADFMGSPLRSVDCNKIQSGVHAAAATLSDAEALDVNSHVFQWLQDNISELQALVPVVKDLQCPALKSRHFDTLNTIRTHIFDASHALEVRQFTDRGLTKYAADIQLLRERAEFESNIEVKMHSVWKDCVKLALEFEADKENRNVSLINNLLLLEDMFDDAGITIESCMRSINSDPHQVRLREIHSFLSHWRTTIKNLKDLQCGYIRLRNIYTNSRTSRQFNSSLKFFKAVDDTWRNVMKIIRATPVVSEFSKFRNLLAFLDEGCLFVEQNNIEISKCVDEQCQMWPKLYLLDHKQIIEALGIHRPINSFYKCIELLPSVTDVVFRLPEMAYVEGVWSYDEKIDFIKPFSPRALTELFRGMESRLSEKIARDLKYFLEESKSILDDLRAPLSTDQARLCSLNAKFWGHFYTLVKDTDNRQGLDILLEETNATFKFATAIAAKMATPYQRKSVYNTLLLLISHRDLLAKLMTDPKVEKGEISFLVDASLKAIWDVDKGLLSIRQSFLHIPYGYKYQGFCERMIVTPLSDKCFLHLNFALQAVTVPTVHGFRSSNKKILVRSLAYELGTECISVDCARQTINSSTLAATILSSVGSQFWLTFYNTEALSLEMLSILFTAVTGVYNALASKSSIIHVCGRVLDMSPPLTNTMTANSIRIPQSGSSQLYRMTLIVNNCKQSKDVSDMPLPLPFTTRRLFRPIAVYPPPRFPIISTLLSSLGFDSISSQISVKIDQVCEYFVKIKDFDSSLVFRLAMQSIRSVAENVKEQQDKEVMTSLIVKALFKAFPTYQRSQITDDDIKFVSDTFLEAFANEADLKAFQPQSYFTPEELLYNHLISPLTSMCTFVLVVGTVASGKTTIISSAASRAIAERNRLARYFASKSMDETVRDARQPVNGGVIDSSPLAARVPPLHSEFQTTMAEMGDYIFGIPVNLSKEITSLTLRNCVGGFKSQLTTEDKLIHLLRFDLESSVQLPTMFTESTQCALLLQQPLQVVLEVAELRHVDPASTTKMSVVYVDNRDQSNFSIRDAINSALAFFTGEGCNLNLSGVVNSCIDLYLMPCLGNLPSDNQINPLFLVNACTSVFCAIYHSSGMDPANPRKFCEASVYRIFFFSCIWTFGVCSPSAREAFEKWFQRYLANYDPRSVVSEALEASIISPSTASSQGAQKSLPVSQTQKIQDEFLDKGTDSVTKSPHGKFMNENLQIELPLGLKVLEPLLLIEKNSIFDYYLHPINKNEVSLQWVTSTPFAMVNCLQIDVSDEGNPNFRSNRIVEGVSENPSHLSKFSRVLCNDLPKQLLSKSPLCDNGYHNLLVPTATGDAVSFIYSCMSKAEGGHILITGPAGSGISSLVKQLCLDVSSPYDAAVFNDRNKFSCAKIQTSKPLRWMCHLSGCRIEDVSKCVSSCQEMNNPAFVEKNLTPSGIIIIEDVSFESQDTPDLWRPPQVNHVMEWLRNICEHKTKLYCDENPSLSQQLKQWRKMHNICTIISKRMEQPTIDHERLTRHFITIFHPEAELETIFTTHILSRVPTLKANLCHDVMNLTIKLIEALIKKAKTLRWDDRLKPQQTTFYSLLSLQGTAASMEPIISAMTASLATFGIFTSNDCIRIWDRLTFDAFAYFPGADNELHLCTDAAMQSLNFSFPSFSEIVIRERLKRNDIKARMTISNESDLANITSNEHIDGVIPPSEADIKKEVELSTTIGFFKNAPDAFIGIQSADFMREKFLAKFPGNIRENLGINIDLESKILWMDIQRLVINMSLVFHQGVPCYTFLLGSNIEALSDVIVLASKVVNVSSRCSHLLMHSPGALNERSSKISSDFQNFREKNPLEDLKRGLTHSYQVWHVHITSESCVHTDVWERIERILTLAEISDTFDYETRKMAAYYMRNQAFVFSFSSNSLVEMIASSIANVRPFASRVKPIVMSTSYCVPWKRYENMYGDVVYSCIMKLILESATTAQSYIPSKYSNIREIVRSDSYTAGTLKLIKTLYDASHSLLGKGWKTSLSENISSFSIKAHQRESEKKMALESKQAEDPKPRDPSGRKSRRFSIMNEGSLIVLGTFDESLLCDAVFNAISSRYILLLPRESQALALHKLTSSLRSVEFTRRRDFDCLCLASIATYTQLSMESHSLARDVISVARNLPETSHGRRILGALGISSIAYDLATSSSTSFQCENSLQSIAQIYDESFLGSLLLQEILPSARFHYCKDHSSEIRLLEVTRLHPTAPTTASTPNNFSDVFLPSITPIRDSSASIIIFPLDSSTLSEFFVSYLLLKQSVGHESTTKLEYAMHDMLEKDEKDALLKVIQMINAALHVCDAYISKTMMKVPCIGYYFWNRFKANLHSISGVKSNGENQPPSINTCVSEAFFLVIHEIRQLLSADMHQLLDVALFFRIELLDAPNAAHHTSSIISHLKKSTSLTSTISFIPSIVNPSTNTMSSQDSDQNLGAVHMKPTKDQNTVDVDQSACRIEQGKGNAITDENDNTLQFSSEAIENLKEALVAANEASCSTIEKDPKCHQSGQNITEISNADKSLPQCTSSPAVEIIDHIKSHAEIWRNWVEDLDISEFPIIPSLSRPLTNLEKITLAFFIKPCILAKLFTETYLKALNSSNDTLEADISHSTNASDDSLFGGTLNKTAFSDPLFLISPNSLQSIGNSTIHKKEVYLASNFLLEYIQASNLNNDEEDHSPNYIEHDPVDGETLTNKEERFETNSTLSSPDFSTQNRHNEGKLSTQRSLWHLLALSEDFTIKELLEIRKEAAHRDVDCIFETQSMSWSALSDIASTSEQNKIIFASTGRRIFPCNKTETFIDILSKSAGTVAKSMPPPFSYIDQTYRLRWLLTIHHAVLLTRFSRKQILADDNTLIFAIKALESLLFNTDSTTTTTTSIALEENVMGIHKPVEKLLAEYVAIFYQSTLRNNILFKIARGIAHSYFSAGCLDVGSSFDMVSTYYIQGAIAIPSDFSHLSISNFINACLSELKSGKVSIIDLLGCTAAELHSSETNFARGSLARLSKLIKIPTSPGENDTSIDDISRMLPHENVKGTSHAGPKSTQSMNDTPTHPLACKFTSYNSPIRLLERFRMALQSLLNIFPKRINTEALEVKENAKKFVLGLKSKSQDTQRATIVYDAAARRRARQRQPFLRVPVREYDPIWLYALSECSVYNDSIFSLRQQIVNLIRLSCLENWNQSIASLSHVEEVVEMLENGFVPKHWMWKSSALSDCPSEPSLPTTISTWIESIRRRRDMLFSWVMNGSPPILSLHLLQNPRGLLHALKESLSFKVDVNFDKIHIKAILVSDATFSSEPLTLNLHSMKQSDICSILAGDIRLRHGTIINDVATVDLLPRAAISSSATKMMLRIFPIHEDSNASRSPSECAEEGISFPLFVNPEFPPSYTCILHKFDKYSLFAGKWRGHLYQKPDQDQHTSLSKSFEDEPILELSLPCTEDKEDATMLGITFHSSSHTTI